jgi:hypothetical protein
MSIITKKYVSALQKRYEAEMAEAEANIALYLSGQNLAAIGEHSDLMEEQDKWIEKYTNAKDKLETLKSLDLNDSDLEKKSPERINS